MIIRNLALFLIAAIAPGLVHAAGSRNPLLPRPQKVRYADSGAFPLRGASITVANSPAAPEDSFAAAQLASGLRRASTSDAPARSSPTAAIVLRRTGAVDALPARDEPAGPQSRESYQLRITPSRVELSSPSSAGLFYGVQTLLQMVEGSGPSATLPAAEVDDWPSMAYRGLMVDMSHGPLPTEAEIQRQIDALARWKGNQYYFYSELSIEAKGQPIINPGARYSQDQVARIIRYARQRHVDVVPCLEFYGHLHDLFRLERFAGMSALPHGGEINPRNPAVQAFLDDYLNQMLALFPSPWFHIGLDEPWELERAGSAAAGGADPATLYIDHLKRMSETVSRAGKRALFWADVTSGAALFSRYPQMAGGLPKNVVAVPWHYDDEKDYTQILEPFSKVGVPQVVGTGIWAWDTLTPNWTVTFGNIDGFIRDGRKFGAIGIVNTNWSDDAQVLYRSTLPGIAYGAAAAWQSVPMARQTFFDEYSALTYSPEVAPLVAQALRAMAEAQNKLAAALGGELRFRLWDEPLVSERLARIAAHGAELHQGRLAAETAQEHLLNALSRHDDAYSLPSLLLEARLLDYAGMKFQFAAEIAEQYSKLGPSSTRADMSFWLGREAASRNHSRAADLMDTIGDLRDAYQRCWEAEYTPYRMRTALGRFDAELEYWRRFQTRVWELHRGYRNGAALPPLESLAR
jgi:hexosaminidase